MSSHQRFSSKRSTEKWVKSVVKKLACKKKSSFVSKKKVLKMFSYPKNSRLPPHRPKVKSYVSHLQRKSVKLSKSVVITKKLPRVDYDYVKRSEKVVFGTFWIEACST